MKTILIVDDSAFTRGIHRRIIEAEGYSALEAASGADALESFSAHAPDLCLVDLLLPDMDGMDVIREILSRDADARTVICSTDKQRYRREDAEAAGARGFLAKPVSPDELGELLKKVLSDD